jgi:hypothetical protein
MSLKTRDELENVCVEMLTDQDRCNVRRESHYPGMNHPFLSANMLAAEWEQGDETGGQR